MKVKKFEATIIDTITEDPNEYNLSPKKSTPSSKKFIKEIDNEINISFNKYETNDSKNINIALNLNFENNINIITQQCKRRTNKFTDFDEESQKFPERGEIRLNTPKSINISINNLSLKQGIKQYKTMNMCNKKNTYDRRLYTIYNVNDLCSILKDDLKITTKNPSSLNKFFNSIWEDVKDINHVSINSRLDKIYKGLSQSINIISSSDDD